MHLNWIICNRLFVFTVLFILLFIVLFIICGSFLSFDFYDWYLYIVLFEGYLFPLNLDDLGYTSKPKHHFTKKNTFYNFWLISFNSFHFLICFCFETISQKNSGTNPPPPFNRCCWLSKRAVFGFFSFPAYATLI